MVSFISKFANIHFIHVLTLLIVTCILYNLLDWKYGEDINIEEEDND